MPRRILGIGSGEGEQPDGGCPKRTLSLEDIWNQEKPASLCRRAEPGNSPRRCMEQEWRRDPAHGIKGQWESQVFRWGGLQQGSGRAQLSHQQRDALTRTLGRRGSTAVTEDE